MRHSRNLLLVFVLGPFAVALVGVVIYFFLSNADNADTPEAQAIIKILQRDALLGEVRNEAPKTDTVAGASINYAAALESTNFDQAPTSFQEAFLKHAQAWRAFGEELQKYPELDVHRLEMHDAIDTILETDEEARAALQERLDQIWATWEGVVEESWNHGVDPDSV